MNATTAHHPGEAYLHKLRHALAVLDRQLPVLQAQHAREQSQIDASADQAVWQVLIGGGVSLDYLSLPDHRQGDAQAFRIASYLRVRDRLATELAKWAEPLAAPP